MPSWLLHYWNGTLLIRLEGYLPERFLNLCCANQIELWDMQYVPNGYQFYITVKDYRKIKPLVRKSKVRVTLLSKWGLPFFLYRNRGRKLLFAGILAFFLILKGMSLYIWDIHFDGNQMYTTDILEDFLSGQEIRYGMKKSQIDCERLEEEIRSSFPEIIWVSARVTGTRLRIQIKENEVVLTLPKKPDEPQDLIAAKSGVITRMIIRSGKAQVKIGDRVEKGQILVSSAMSITNDAMEVVTTHYVHADADIYAQTEYYYENARFPLTQTVSETGRKRKGLRLRLGTVSFKLLYPIQTNECWIDVTGEHQLKIFESFRLPVFLDIVTGKECQIYERNYTEEEKKNIALDNHNQIMKKIMEKGVPIIENNVKILDDSLTFRVQGHLVLEEEVSVGNMINIQEELKQPDEYNGNNH